MSLWEQRANGLRGFVRGAYVSNGREGALSPRVPEQILLSVPRIGLTSQEGEGIGTGQLGQDACHKLKASVAYTVRSCHTHSKKAKQSLKLPTTKEGWRIPSQFSVALG